jgi:hypothetical protein
VPDRAAPRRCGAGSAGGPPLSRCAAPLGGASGAVEKRWRPGGGACDGLGRRRAQRGDPPNRKYGSRMTVFPDPLDRAHGCCLLRPSLSAVCRHDSDTRCRRRPRRALPSRRSAAGPRARAATHETRAPCLSVPRGGCGGGLPTRADSEARDASSGAPRGRPPQSGLRVCKTRNNASLATPHTGTLRPARPCRHGVTDGLLWNRPGRAGPGPLPARPVRVEGVIDRLRRRKIARLPGLAAAGPVEGRARTIRAVW